MNPNRAVAYVRVSTQEQAQHGVSLDAQESRIRAYAVLQGLHLVTFIREEGVSAAKALSSRPGGQALLALLAAEQAQHVVALKLDRLFRDAADCLNQTRAWDASNVAMHLVDMNGMALSTGSAMGRMFLTMAAGFAELERNLISERTKAALAYKKEQGVRLGRPPLGPAADDAAVVARIRDMQTAKWTLREMAAALEAEGFSTKKGGKWAPETLRKIMARQSA
jgi:DNA invertase Pin-like site-specific DNA recombinase